MFFTQLLDTKSTDRKMTLLHYIALIVKEKYPELTNFYNELHFVDKAAAGEHAPNIKLCQQPRGDAVFSQKGQVLTSG